MIMKKAFGMVIVALSVAFLLSSVPLSADVNQTYFYYQQLDANERVIYDILCSTDTSEREIEIDLPVVITIESADPVRHINNIVADMQSKVRFAIEFGEPFSHWGWHGCKMELKGTVTEGSGTATLTGITAILTVSPEYDDPDTEKDELAEKKVELLRNIEGFSTKSTDRRGIIGDINQFLIDTASYDPNFNDESKISPYAHDAYGAIVAEGHLAVCDGYSKAFMLLCRQYDIPCIMDMGSALPITKNVGHAWNYVQMEDGAWYAVDVTWNDSLGNEFLLVGADTFFTTHQQGAVIDPNFRSPFTIPTISKDRFDPYPPSYDQYAWTIALAIAVILAIVIYREIRNSKSA